MPNRLKKLAINFVSLVDRPANQPAEIVLTKRDDSDDPPAEVLTGDEMWLSADEAEALEKADRKKRKGASSQTASLFADNEQDPDNDGDDDSFGEVGKARKKPKPTNANPDPDHDGDDDRTAAGDTDHDYHKRSFSASRRKEMADKGQAESDGSYPIENTSDLDNAIEAFGRSKNKAKTKAHIISRARALGATSALPDSWGVGKSSPQESPVPPTTEAPATLTKADVDQQIAEAIAKYQAEQAEKVTKLESDLTAANERAERAELVAKAEQNAREETEAIAKAARDYPNLPGTTPQALAPILRKAASALTEEEFKVLDDTLKAASVAVGKSDLFREHGGPNSVTKADGSQSAYGQLETVAKGMRDSDPKLSVPQSMDRAMSARPDLVAQYRDEMGFAVKN